MKFLICEDEDIQTEFLTKCIHEWGDSVKENIEIKSYKNAESLLFDWEDIGYKYDVLMLDIEMDRMNGMELAKKLREMKSDIRIIFVTGVKDFVFDGYSVSAVSYVLKPVKKDKLFEFFEKVKNSMSVEEPYIILSEDRTVRKIKLSDIVFIESSGHYSSIYTLKEEIKSLTGINEIEKKLDKRFYRIHRSYIVSIPWIESITKKDAIMEGGISIPIARGKWKEINKAYLDYYREV